MRRLPALALLLLALPAWGQRPPSLEGELKQAYADHMVILRTYYSGERLRFDAMGLPLEAGAVGAWTTDGQILVQDLTLAPGAIRLRGQRQHFLFGLNGDLRHHNAGPVTVELELAAPLRTRADAARAMARVFLRSDEKAADFAPAYWKFILTHQWQSVEFALADFLPGETLYTPGRGDVTWPKVIGRGDALDAPIAVCGQVEGEVGLMGVIGPDGALRALQITDPFGLGLDDRAAAIISQWRFQPARKGSQPVSAQVQFWIYFHRDAC
jgi:hypothetical protein